MLRDVPAPLPAPSAALLPSMSANQVQSPAAGSAGGWESGGGDAFKLGDVKEEEQEEVKEERVVEEERVWVRADSVPKV